MKKYIYLVFIEKIQIFSASNFFSFLQSSPNWFKCYSLYVEIKSCFGWMSGTSGVIWPGQCWLMSLRDWKLDIFYGNLLSDLLSMFVCMIVTLLFVCEGRVMMHKVTTLAWPSQVPSNIPRWLHSLIIYHRYFYLYHYQGVFIN